ncbi:MULTISPECIES: pyrroline-5-carboxylate reductase [Bacillaceae]|uniref:Pyrroline-5-carboxylate reductase n=1 Tax=Evansella alkalicola TaxID=745819 RepID=A0ABS6K089_9BACI|nr:MULTISPECIES: pyrroline-5-carboxylate reductase [Bacillaceae]MBU9724060.1 pyrroline-5-carboxylate reductase [Bacillus alkalicola]
MKISIIGAGNMAEALIVGWLKKGYLENSQITITNRSNNERLEDLQRVYNINTTRVSSDIVSSGSIILLACKPKDWRSAIEPFKHLFNHKTPIVSVMAGVSTAVIEEELEHEDVPVIRIMPNTSATVGESMTPISYGKSVPYQYRDMIINLFQAVGETAEVPEDQMDAMTALVGTGPAYIYYLMESMEMAAIQMGIDPKLATTLVSQTLLGASQRVQQSDASPRDLYDQIMSPGGTTEAGFKVLTDNKVQESLVSCVLRAWERSKELGNQNAYIE